MAGASKGRKRERGGIFQTGDHPSWVQRTNATVNQQLDRHLDIHTGEASTVSGYRSYVGKHVRPFLGRVKVGALEPEVLDSLYAELRRCRDHCTSRRQIQHRTKVRHQCDERCRPHECVPLANATIRKIHFILSGAYKRAVRVWAAASAPRSGEEVEGPQHDAGGADADTRQPGPGGPRAPSNARG